MLAERKELQTAHGKLAFSILLFQDLAATDGMKATRSAPASSAGRKVRGDMAISPGATTRL
jgi:hypothetical protein